MLPFLSNRQTADGNDNDEESEDEQPLDGK
mgnify:CR=1 FL=1